MAPNDKLTMRRLNSIRLLRTYTRISDRFAVY